MTKCKGGNTSNEGLVWSGLLLEEFEWEEAKPNCEKFFAKEDSSIIRGWFLGHTHNM
jgi:hypothetical protein